MISRSNYIAITLIMCIVLLMFQLTGISENVLMNDGENIYAQEAVPEEQVAPEQQSYEDQMDQRGSCYSDERMCRTDRRSIGRMSGDRERLERITEEGLLLLWQSWGSSGGCVRGWIPDCGRYNAWRNRCGSVADIGRSGEACGGLRPSGLATFGYEPCTASESGNPGDCRR